MTLLVPALGLWPEKHIPYSILQNKEDDLDYATRQLHVNTNSLVNCRCDECFEQI